MVLLLCMTSLPVLIRATPQLAVRRARAEQRKMKRAPRTVRDGSLAASPLPSPLGVQVARAHCRRTSSYTLRLCSAKQDQRRKGRPHTWLTRQDNPSFCAAAAPPSYVRVDPSQPLRFAAVFNAHSHTPSIRFELPTARPIHDRRDQSAPESPPNKQPSADPTAASNAAPTHHARHAFAGLPFPRDGRNTT